MCFQLEKWWEDVAYMEGRLPNPLMNMSGPGPYLFDVWKPKLGTKIPRMALMLHYMVHFWLLSRKYVNMLMNVHVYDTHQCMIFILIYCVI